VARTPDLIQRYISDHCPPTYSVSQLTYLVSVCTRMVDSPEEQPYTTRPHEASASVYIAKMFCTWLHLIVSHWEALLILSHNATRSESVHPDCSSRCAGWPRFLQNCRMGAHNQDTCLEPLPASDGEIINADAVIKHPQGQITITLQTKHCHSIFHRFRISWRGIVHCEALLAFLVSFVDNLPAG
jgi:hypothetical protein